MENQALRLPESAFSRIMRSDPPDSAGKHILEDVARAIEYVREVGYGSASTGYKIKDGNDWKIDMQLTLSRERRPDDPKPADKDQGSFFRWLRARVR